MVAYSISNNGDSRMRTFAKKSTGSADSEGGAPLRADKSANGDNWFRKHWCGLTLLVIVVVAFLLRFCFAYGISVGDNYALSGGSSAASHRRIINEILWGTYNPGSESALNYPYGVESIFGPLYDYCCAAWAKLFTVFVKDYDLCAGAALAVNPPIFGALTCIPVFMIADKMFKGDKMIALLAAAFYAVFAVLIMTTPFSYGTETAFVAFLIAGLVYFLVTAFSVVDGKGLEGVKAFLDRQALIPTLLAAAFLAFIVLSWTGFWAIMMTAGIMMFFTLLFNRLTGKSMGATVGIVSVVLLVGAVAGACYYIPYGMWDSVFSGGFMVAVLTVVYSFIFLMLEKKPWVLSIPVTAIVMIAVAVVLYFAMPSLSSAILSGNDVYIGSLMSSLASETSRTSISAMASYYGWLTLWFPLVFGVWMLYNYRKNSKSTVYNFTMLWLLACYCVGWFNAEYCAYAGAGFAVGCAALIVSVFRAVDLKSYFRSLRGNGVKAGAKKALNFFPLVTVLVAVLLVAVPTAVYAADASTPSNTDDGYFGGMGYSINTSDSSLVSSAWSNSKNYATGADKTLLSWYGYSDTASSLGGFKTVTSSTGGGTSAMASTLLASSSAGAVASLAIRIMESDFNAYKTQLIDAGLTAEDADALLKYLTSESDARKYMADNVSEFTGYNASPAAESLPYIVGVQFLTSKLTEQKIAGLYEAVCAASGNSINYIEVDASMIPLYYGDNSYASSVAYFGDYAISKYNAPSEFYSVTSTTEYYYQYGYYDRLYYTYNDALYDTFMWNAVMGVTLDTYGSSTNIDLLSKLSVSDGAVKAVPGTGLGHFKVVYWHLNYRASETDKWVEMDATEAIAKQNADGGQINYLSSVVVLQYVPNASLSFQEHTVDLGSADASAVKVAVFEKLASGDVGYDSTGVVSYVQRYTDLSIGGNYSVAVPTSGDYLVKYYVGSTGLRDGTLLQTGTSAADVSISTCTVSGKLVGSDGTTAIQNSGATLAFTGSDGKVKIDNVAVATDGTFSATGVAVDKYTVTIYSSSGTKLSDASLNVLADVTGLNLSAGGGNIVVTYLDMFGNTMSATPTVTVRDASGNTVYSDIGTTIGVVAGTYSVFVSDGTYVSTSTVSTTVSSSSDGKASLTLYNGTAQGAAGAVGMAIGYNTVLDGTATVPTTAKDYITAYALDTSTMEKVTGTVKYSGSGVQATVVFIDQTSAGKTAYVFESASSGAFTAYLPDATYSVYAYSNNSAVSYEKDFTVSDVVEGKEITLNDGRKVSFTVNYTTFMSPSTTGLLYVPIELVVNSEYTMYLITGADGKATAYVPNESSIKYTMSAASIDSHFENVSDWTKTETLTADATYTYTIAGKVTDGKANTKAIPMASLHVDGITAETQLHFVAYNSTNTSVYVTVNASGTITAINPKKDGSGDPLTAVVPGRYTVTSETDTVYLTSTSVNIYPSSTSITLEPESVFQKTFKTSTSNTVTVVGLPDASGNTGNHHQDTTTVDSNYTYTLSLQTGFEYYVTITSSDGKSVYYTEVLSASSAADLGELNTLAEAKTLSGYFGSLTAGNVTGDFTIDTNARKYYVTVSDGEFTVSLPVNASVTGMTLEANATSDGYKYTAETTVDTSVFPITVDADKTQNFAMKTAKAADTDKVNISAATMNCDTGAGSVTLTFPDAGTYTVTGGTGFVLDKSYTVTVAAAGTATVDGKFNTASIGAGNANAAVTVTKVGETEGTTLVIPASSYTGGTTGDLTVTLAADEGSKVQDAVDGHSYRYVLGFDNKNSAAKTIKFDIANCAVTGDTAADWIVSVVDASGYLVNADAYEVAGLTTTNLYVMLINKTSSDSALPAGGATVAFASGSDYLTAVTISGPQSGQVTVDSGSASGNGVENTKAQISTGFWILVVFTILLVLLIVWGAMKRGVFSRRN